jgi:hypothetical protein
VNTKNKYFDSAIKTLFPNEYEALQDVVFVGSTRVGDPMTDRKYFPLTLVKALRPIHDSMPFVHEMQLDIEKLHNLEEKADTSEETTLLTSTLNASRNARKYMDKGDDAMAL